jgi:hypothetical protein
LESGSCEVNSRADGDLSGFFDEFSTPALASNLKNINRLTHQKKPENSLDMAGGFF